MLDPVFRPFLGPEDADRQYDLWLRATEGLTYSWRSTPGNVRALMAHVPRCPNARIYAETGGRLVGYIGVHEPIGWNAGAGVALPFGFPWTYPIDPELEVRLYDRMISAAPGLYPAQRADFYVQRFRASWSRHHAFLRARGWREFSREPILTTSLGPLPLAEAPDDGLKPLGPDDLAEVARIAANDTHATRRPDAAALERRYAAGWQEWETSWLLPGAGAASLERRGPWAEVKMFYAPDDALDALLRALRLRAARLGARELYFTLKPEQTALAELLRIRGFREADADVYVRLDR